MLVHIGNNSSIDSGDIIAVIDSDTSTISKVTRNFLKVSSDKKIVEYTTNDIPKSFILADTPNGIKIFVSCVSPSTIAGRISKILSGHPDK